MSIAADDLPLPHRGHFEKKRYRDGTQKNVLISKDMTGLN
jgi:hypothetical protein